MDPAIAALIGALSGSIITGLIAPLITARVTRHYATRDRIAVAAAAMAQSLTDSARKGRSGRITMETFDRSEAAIADLEALVTTKDWTMIKILEDSTAALWRGDPDGALIIAATRRTLFRWVRGELRGRDIWPTHHRFIKASREGVEQIEVDGRRVWVNKTTGRPEVAPGTRGVGL